VDAGLVEGRGEEIEKPAILDVTREETEVPALVGAAGGARVEAARAAVSAELEVSFNIS
jgi:hypothetical protein